MKTTIRLFLALLGLSLAGPKATAVSPAPDGGYSNGNTAEGQNALFSLSTGGYNTAVGFFSLRSNTTGAFNTGLGAGTLLANTANQNTATGAGTLLSNTTGENNTGNGVFALVSNTTGAQNAAIGAGALQSNTTGSNNTAVGYQALLGSTGDGNTATGSQALSNNTANFNTATGFAALFGNTTGGANTATGYQVLASNTQGSSNTAMGNRALFHNTTTSNNTAIGDSALYANSKGYDNTATGVAALIGNTTGTENTATGSFALASNTDGIGNTAIGNLTLLNNTIGIYNTAIGYKALYSNTGLCSNNVAIGAYAGYNITTANFVTCLGESAGINHHTGDHNLYVGNEGVDGESHTIRLGSGINHTSTFIAAVRGVTTGQSNAVPVLIDGAGQLGTASSSQRFKHDIKPMDATSESILALKPVTFHYKSDKTNRPEFGLIAEEVAGVNPDLVVCDKDGEIYTVRYDAVNAMLLNEFLKEHRKVEEQEATITKLKKDFRATIAELTARVDEQESQIQKVSAQLQFCKPVPQTVASDH